jgi:hypothetical protein
MSDDDMKKIATALAVLSGDALELIDMQFVLLDVPLPIRETIWKEVARRATQNAEDCREVEI